MINNIKLFITENLLRSYLFMFCESPKLSSYICSVEFLDENSMKIIYMENEKTEITNQLRELLQNFPQDNKVSCPSLSILDRTGNVVYKLIFTIDSFSIPIPSRLAHDSKNAVSFSVILKISKLTYWNKERNQNE